MKKKRSITLIEIMIVIVLIGLIGGALAFNMRGSVDKGRAFKTEQNIARIQDILMLESAQNDLTLNEVAGNALNTLNRSPLVEDGSRLLRDGWGNTLTITVDPNQERLTITSDRYENWKTAHE